MRYHISKKYAHIALMASLGIILGYLENMFIPDLVLPGVKLGISNLAVLIVLLKYTYKEAIAVGVIKSLVNGIAFSGLMSCFYSLAGVILSVLIMSNLKKFYFKDKITCIGISVAGSGFFNIGQLTVACFVLKSFIPFYYLGYYLLVSVVTGFIVGTVGEIIIKKGVAPNEKI